MTAIQRLEQACKDYDELLTKMRRMRFSHRLSTEEQFDLSLTVLKLKKTLDPRNTVRKTLMAARRRKQ